MHTPAFAKFLDSVFTMQIDGLVNRVRPRPLKYLSYSLYRRPWAFATFNPYVYQGEIQLIPMRYSGFGAFGCLYRRRKNTYLCMLKGSKRGDCQRRLCSFTAMNIRIPEAAAMNAPTPSMSG